MLSQIDLVSRMHHSVERDAALEFPIKESGVAYFNNASYTPMSKYAIDAISQAITSYSRSGPDDAFYANFKEGANDAKRKLAKILNSSPDELVFTESATQSIDFVANGLKHSKGDTWIVRGLATEHPSNSLPWRYYSSAKAVNLIDLGVDSLGLPDLSELDSILKSTHAKLVVASHVIYNLGTVMPVREMCKIAHERGALFFLDASQSVVSVPVDLQGIDCDFMAGTAAKWLCGPLGLGFFFCKRESLEHLQPLNFGAMACDSYKPDGSFEVARGVVRLQEGFRNWAYAYGLGAAIDVLEDFGLEKVRSKNLDMADAIIETIKKHHERYRFIGSESESLRTSIIPLECLESRPLDVVERLRKLGITIAEREIGPKKILRISPHFYNDESELERLTDAL